MNGGSIHPLIFLNSAITQIRLSTGETDCKVDASSAHLPSRTEESDIKGEAF
jgi:hypothetical protein